MNKFHQDTYPKGVSVILDCGLTFKYDLNSVLIKSKIGNKTTGKLQNRIRRPALNTLCQAFVMNHSDCGDIFYKQVFNINFHQKLGKLQCNIYPVKITIITKIITITIKFCHVWQCSFSKFDTDIYHSTKFWFFLKKLQRWTVFYFRE